MKTKTPKYKLVLKDSLGEALHVALRKGCDSTPTTVAYNLVSLMPNTLWHEWLEAVWKGLKSLTQPPTRDAVRVAVKLASLDLYRPGSYYVGERDMDHKKPGSQREFINGLPACETVGKTIDEILREREQWRWIWQGTLKMFSEDDWGGFTCFLLSGGPND